MKNEPSSQSADTQSSPPGRTRSISALMWRRFKRNRIALISLWILAVMYFVAFFAAFFAPHSVSARFAEYRFAPPTKIHFLNENGLTWPYVRKLEKPVMDRESFRRIYRENMDEAFSLRFFVKGEPYRLFGLIPMERHFFGTGNTDVPIFLMGTDRFGRDLFSRILFGSQVSLSVGLVGVALTVLIGSLLGVVSGYFGGVIDLLIQRLIEIINAIPTLPLWLALAAIVPSTWSSLATYFMITVILSFIGWTGLGRTVRGLTLRLQNSDLVLASRCIGAGDGRVLVKHMLPYSYSMIIVSGSLSIPGTIIGETALSFLGLGIRPPMVSWGVLLADAQNVSNLAFYPWLLFPAVFVVLVVLAFNFVGDGARDAADPFTY